MKQIRRNVFETNSSSSHSLSFTNTSLVPNEMEIVGYSWEYEVDDVILVPLQGFCGEWDNSSQYEKLAYLILQLGYITKHDYEVGNLYFHGSKEERIKALNDFYYTDEFMELESAICEHAGCKHVRIDLNTDGYIDHDSVASDMDELRYNFMYGYSYVDLVFGADTNVHFEFLG